MTEKDVRKIVSDMLMSFSNKVVPQHTHNGVDCNPIPLKNILYTSAGFDSSGNVLIGSTTGVPFIGSNIQGASNYQYNIFALNTSGPNPLVIQPNQATFDSGGANLYFGLSDIFSGKGPLFNRIFMNVDGVPLQEEITFSATDTVGGGTNAGSLSVQAGIVDIQSTDGIADSSQATLLPAKFQLVSDTGTFAFQLPDAPRVPSPTAGMIAFEGGIFYACEVTGTWRTITTAP